MHMKCKKKGKNRKKVYAAVEKDGLFAVIKTVGYKYKYMLSGGSVEEGETNREAIIREIN